MKQIKFTEQINRVALCHPAYSLRSATVSRERMYCKAPGCTRDIFNPRSFGKERFKGRGMSAAALYITRDILKREDVASSESLLIYQPVQLR